MTQKELSVASGIDSTSVQRYLAGRRHIRVDDLGAIAKALSTTAEAVIREAEARADRRLEPDDEVATRAKEIVANARENAQRDPDPEPDQPQSPPESQPGGEA